MQSEFKEQILKLEKIFKIETINKEIFTKALTHGSFTRENEIDSLANYERLEFLGDADDFDAWVVAADMIHPAA